eukprot:9438594-Pyramimonas_sp.AAC.1
MGKKQREALQLLAAAPKHGIPGEIPRTLSALCFPSDPRDLRCEIQASMCRVAMKSKASPVTQGRFAWLEDVDVD